MVAAPDVPRIDSYLRLPQVQQAMPRGLVLRWGRQDSNLPADYRTRYLLNSERLIDGTYLEDAQAQRDPQTMRPIVNFQFDRRGGRIFGRGTGANVGRLMAIVLDETVVSAPVINSQIFDRGMIELGGGSIEEAGDLALVLRAGALEAPIEMIEQRSVGPSLGGKGGTSW
jgi:protein-export membrane protein SecD